MSINAAEVQWDDQPQSAPAATAQPPAPTINPDHVQWDAPKPGSRAAFEQAYQRQQTINAQNRAAGVPAPPTPRETQEARAADSASPVAPINAAVQSIKSYGANVVGLLSPETAALAAHEQAMAHPVNPSLVNQGAGLVGGAARGIAEFAVGGPPLMAGEAAASAAGRTRTEVAQARDAGQQVSGAQEAAGAIGQAAVAGGAAYLGGAALGSPALGVAGRIAGTAALGGAQQAGENAVAKATYDPNRPLMQGVPQAAAGGAVLGIGGEVLHAVTGRGQQQINPNEVQWDQPTKGQSDVPSPNAEQQPVPQQQPEQPAAAPKQGQEAAADQGIQQPPQPQEEAQTQGQVQEGQAEHSGRAEQLPIAQPPQEQLRTDVPNNETSEPQQPAQAAQPARVEPGTNAQPAPAPLPPLHPDVHSSVVTDAWKQVAAEQPETAKQITRIEPLDNYKYPTANASFNPETGVLRVNVDKPLTPETLRHEFEHVAQAQRGEAKSMSEFNTEEEFQRAVEDPARAAAVKPAEGGSLDASSETPTQPQSAPAPSESDRAEAAVEQTTPQQTAPKAPESPGRQELRQTLQTRIENGKIANVPTKAIQKFAGEPWADEVLATRQPRKPTSPDALSSQRAQLQDQLRDLVVKEQGPGISDLSDTHPLAMQVMRGEQSPGKLISLDTAIDEAQKLPDGHPARVALHNLQELEKNPRGTKVQAINTNDVQDGTRVVVNDKETFTIDKENQRVEDGVTGDIPEGGMTVYGKKVLPPQESPEAIAALPTSGGETPTLAEQTAKQEAAKPTGDNANFMSDLKKGIESAGGKVSPREARTLSFTDQMKQAADAGEGRQIIKAHEDAINALQRSAGLTPTVGDGADGNEHYYRGFSTVNKNEWRVALKQMKQADPTKAAQLQRLIDDGGTLGKPWNALLDKEGVDQGYDKPTPKAGAKFYQAETPSAAQTGLYGQSVIDSSGIGQQQGMFHEPNAAAPVQSEKIKASAEALKPENTGEMFPRASSDEPTNIVGYGGKAKQAQTTLGSQLLGRAPTFVKEDVAPTAAGAAKAVLEAGNDIRRVLAPQTRSDEARTAANAMREHGATLAQRNDRAAEALSSARKFFDTRSLNDNLDFIDRVETAQPHADPRLGAIAQTMRQMLDQRREEVRGLGKGKLEHFIQDYFPHIWKDPAKASEVYASMLAKRPLEGSKSFLKQRSIDTVKQGVDAGLEPVSENPVDLVLLKLREMDKYITAHNTLNELKGKGLAKYVSVNDRAPEGYAPIDDKIAHVYGPPTIAVSEHVDRAQYDALKQVLGNLGVDHERVISARGEGRRRGASLPQGTVGFSEQGNNRIVTQYATDLSVMAHEIGHQIDSKYDMDRIVGKHVRELDQLTELRWGADEKPSEKNREYNLDPVEQMAQVVEAYVHAPQRMQEVAPNVYKAFDKFVGQHEELDPLRTSPSLSMRKLKNEVPHGGLLKMGQYYAPEPAANVINNYLSPGLRSKSGLFRGYLGLSNVMNQFQLGFSAFHMGFTSADAMVSKVALGMERLINEGKPIAAAKDVGSAVAAPITNLMRGSKVLQEWYKPGSQGEEMARIVDAMKAAGGRAKQDSFYQTQFTDKMMKAFRQGNYAGGALRLPFSIVESLAKPVMEYVVPRQKMGIFADMAQKEMAKLPPGASRDEVRATMAKAWDSVDNRMGQLVYDNLFWNKTAKDLAMASVRSLGWNLGTFRELGGAGVDAMMQAGKLLRGQKPELTHRMAYALALPMVAGGIGGAIHYLMTGKPPGELKDYFFPQTGETDEQGRPMRLSLPTYMKDVAAYQQQPGKTLMNKLHPMISTVSDMLANQDFYGTKIRNSDDPIMKQALDELKYLGKQFEPFSSRGLRQMGDEGVSAGKKILPFVGVTQAPKYLSETPAERMADELAGSAPHAARTPEEANQAKAKADLVKQLRKNPASAPQLLSDAVRAGTIRPDERMQLMKRSRESTLAYRMMHMTPEESMKIWGVASEKERDELRDMIRRKILNNRTMKPEDRMQMLRQITKAAA